MPESDSAARIILTTTASLDEARRLGKTLVEEHLVACATLVPAVESIYRWQGQIEASSEVLLILKTEADQLAALQTRLHQIHSYQTPEVLVLAVKSGSPAYLQWLHESLREG
jgi:periplasmic divalent cation tolerance protein